VTCTLRRRPFAALALCVVLLAASAAVGAAGAGAQSGTGSIAGRVTTFGGFGAINACAWAVSTDFRILGGDEVDGTGNYVITGLPAGEEVAVGFRGCRENRTYVAEWYDDATALADVDLVEVSATGPTTGIDAELAHYGGFLFFLASSTSEPLDGVCVWVTNQNATALVAAQYAPGSGALFSGLLPGQYLVYFTDCGTNGFAPEWYQDAATSAAATPVTVGPSIGGPPQLFAML
jgi:hypothetical protein